MNIKHPIYGDTLRASKEFEDKMAILRSRQPQNVMDDDNYILKNQESLLPMAINVLGSALAEDLTPGSYYYGWQSNLACTIMDHSDVNHRRANMIAIEFLDKLIRKEDWTMYESNKKLMEQTHFTARTITESEKEEFFKDYNDTDADQERFMTDILGEKKISTKIPEDKITRNDRGEYLMENGRYGTTKEYLNGKFGVTRSEEIKQDKINDHINGIEYRAFGKPVLTGEDAIAQAKKDRLNVNSNDTVRLIKQGIGTGMYMDSLFKKEDNRSCGPTLSKDMVNHPTHYIAKGGIEVIDVIAAFTEGLIGVEATDTGNIIKYACRWKNKNGVEDLKKILWYTQHLISLLEKKSDTVQIHDGEGNLIGTIEDYNNLKK